MLQHDSSFFEKRGYNKDIMSKITWTKKFILIFLTLGVGAVHNIRNYIAVGDVLQLGLSPFQVMVSFVG